jgi:amino acid transporter
MILDYVLVPLLSAVFVAVTAARLVPQIPYAVWAALFCGAVTLTNMRGIEVTKRANTLMLAIMSVSAVLFIAACLAYTMNSMPAGSLFNSRALFDPASFRFSALLSGASIATLSYLGFDAVSTLAEDAKDPQRDIGFATVAVCLIQTAICFLIVYLAAVVWPNYRSITNVETAILDISQLSGGTALFAVTTAALLVAAIASSIASQAGASRLLFGMGRDGMLPSSLFGYIHPKYSTPTRSIALMGAISFVGALVISFQLVVELVNFGAFVGFILVNLSVIAHYFVRMRMRGAAGITRNLLLPTAGAVVCTGVWLSLSYHAKIVGFAWLAVGIAYLAVLTKGFKRPVLVLELP